MISFREVKLSDAEKILSWRTKSRVTKFMNTDVDYDLNSQVEWLKSCYLKNDYYHWIVKCNDVDIGLISLSEYDNKTTSWGLYIGHDDYLGVGAFVPLYFYNFAFNILNVDSISAEVFYDNTKTIKMHIFHGYKFDPIKNRVIEKNNTEVLLVNLILKKENYLLKKKNKYISDFPTIYWRCGLDI